MDRDSRDQEGDLIIGNTGFEPTQNSERWRGAQDYENPLSASLVPVFLSHESESDRSQETNKPEETFTLGP